MEWVQQFLTQVSGPTAYLLFFLLIMACGCGLPMNSDISLITAAVLASKGVFQIWILIPLAFFALLTGDSITFFAGRKWGYRLIRRRPFKWVLKQKQIERAERYLENHGARFLFVVRYLPLIRTALFFTAGSLKVRPRTFYLMDGLASTLYLPLVMGTAYFASENIDSVIQTFKNFQFLLLAGFLFVLGAVLLRKNSKRKSKGRAT